MEPLPFSAETEMTPKNWPGSSIPALLNPMERYWYDARDKTAYYDVFFDILKYKLLQHLQRVDIDTLKSDFNHIKEGYMK